MKTVESVSYLQELFHVQRCPVADPGFSRGGGGVNPPGGA